MLKISIVFSSNILQNSTNPICSFSLFIWFYVPFQHKTYLRLVSVVAVTLYQWFEHLIWIQNDPRFSFPNLIVLSLSVRTLQNVLFIETSFFLVNVDFIVANMVPIAKYFWSSTISLVVPTLPEYIYLNLFRFTYSCICDVPSSISWRQMTFKKNGLKIWVK